MLLKLKDDDIVFIPRHIYIYGIFNKYKKRNIRYFELIENYNDKKVPRHILFTPIYLNLNPNKIVERSKMFCSSI